MAVSVEKMLVSESASLRDALDVLNRAALGAVFVVDDAGRMVGLLTDGDIRRALLAGATLDAAVGEHMNRAFTSASVTESREEAARRLTERIRHVPRLDESGRPVDLVSWSEFWRLPVMQPALAGNELAYVTDCVQSNWISSQGAYVTKFQDAFSEFLGVEHSLSTSSGTTALHLALVALGIGPGDEVIVPDLTFGASANVVVHTGAKVVFADVDRDTWTLDPADTAARITPKTRAIMPVHLYGHPCDMEPLLALAREHELFVVEDCAEALGATYRDEQVGTFGDVACFSFFANKVITTGEGGMVTTRDPALFEKMIVLRDHGMSKERRYWHLYAGFNYRMTNLQAAIGLAQMERLESFLTYREEVVARYDRQLKDLPGVTLPPRARWARNIHWLYSILVEPTEAGVSAAALASKLSDYGIESRNLFHPLHQQPAYGGDPDASYPNTEWLAERGLSLPTSNDIELDQVDRVCNAIEATIGGARLAERSS